MVFLNSMSANIRACSTNHDVCSDKISQLLIDRDLCFIDIETTGSIFGYHEIIEVGAIRTSADAKTSKDEISFKLQPRYPERLTEEAGRVNGYTPSEWPSLSETASENLEKFISFASGSVPVCHNPSFDRAFLTLSAFDNGINDLGMDHHWIGTESLGWPLFRSGQLRKLSLSGLCEFFGIPPEPNPHTALQGAYACVAVYRKLMESQLLK